MRINFTYRKTAQIEEYLKQLEVNRRLVELLPKVPQLEENIRRESLLKSSLFSARIEGNKLELKDIKYSQENSKNFTKIEVFNILRALRFLNSKKVPKKLTETFILELHKLALRGISSSIGQFRKKRGAIFNQAGQIVYLAPPAPEVPALIKKLVEKINSSKDAGPVKAAIGHFCFEKIHPFLDGNGRVGRLLSTFILRDSGFEFRGLVSFEEYLEKNRQQYYDRLSSTNKDMTAFIEFFLKALVVQTDSAINNLKETREGLPEDNLLPRRKEILQIIRDHQMISFDSIKRRFLKVSESTLHYDLKQLMKEGFIRKLGSTRGVLYTACKVE